MQNAAKLPTHVPTLHQMLMEQQHMIDRLQERLRLALPRQFGPRNEYVNIDQIGLFAADAEADTSTVIELSEASAETGDASVNAPARQEPAERKKAVRILKDLPLELRIIDIRDAEKFCSCCGGELHHFGDECSEHLGYVPASVKILETRRKKYACKSCHGEVKRAKDDAQPPIAKSRASASLIAFLIVCKFADHLPLSRIAARLKRLGIELSHALMSDWLLQASELLEAVYERMVEYRIEREIKILSDAERQQQPQLHSPT